MIAVVDDECCAIAGHGNCNRLLELPGPVAAFTEGRQKSAVRRELLNAVVVEVSDKNVALGVQRYGGHGSEPAIERPENIQR